MAEKLHILDLLPGDFTDACVDADLEAYRADQILQWIYEKRVTDFANMTNLSKLLREKLPQTFTIRDSTELARTESPDGTIKLLLSFGENQQVETVLIPGKRWLTACVSSQFGCPVKCAFCATGQGPFEGNLTAGQIVEQLLALQQIADLSEQRIANVVFMGMGEPMLNYDNVVRAIRIINDPKGLNIGARHITVSTVGIPDGIRQLADEGLQLNLAISLHLCDQRRREQVIPFARTFPLDDVFDAAREYFDRTGREITLEYLLIENLNMSAIDADMLASTAKRLRANVNVIAYNPVEPDAGRESSASDAAPRDSAATAPRQAADFVAPTRDTVDRFVARLQARNVNVNVRASRGRDIAAACGQLRRRVVEGGNGPAANATDNA